MSIWYIQYKHVSSELVLFIFPFAYLIYLQFSGHLHTPIYQHTHAHVFIYVNITLILYCMNIYTHTHIYTFIKIANIAQPSVGTRQSSTSVGTVHIRSEIEFNILHASGWWFHSGWVGCRRGGLGGAALSTHTQKQTQV